jgi:hypothetical protein
VESDTSTREHENGLTTEELDAILEFLESEILRMI